MDPCREFANSCATSGARRVTRSSASWFWDSAPASASPRSPSHSARSLNRSHTVAPIACSSFLKRRRERSGASPPIQPFRIGRRSPTSFNPFPTSPAQGFSCVSVRAPSSSPAYAAPPFFQLVGNAPALGARSLLARRK